MLYRNNYFKLPSYEEYVKYFKRNPTKSNRTRFGVFYGIKSKVMLQFKNYKKLNTRFIIVKVQIYDKEDIFCIEAKKINSNLYLAINKEIKKLSFLNDLEALKAKDLK